jgi:gliding motility-associated-like protein
MKNFISFIVVLFFAHWSIAQCTVTIVTPTTSVECGDCFTLTAVGESDSVQLSEDFNGGAIGPGWSSSSTPMFTNPCGPSLDGTPSAWFGDVAFPRTLTTNAFDVSCGGEICFDLDFAGDDGSSDCEDPDEIDEGVFLHYSINSGATWVEMNYFQPTSNKTGPYYQWANYCFSIPLAAQTTTTIFRWTQPNATATFNDHWGIDNVNISAISCDAYYYDWFEDGIEDSAFISTCQTSSAQDYTVMFTNGIDDTCTATITMNSSIEIDLGPDTVLNCGQGDMDIVGVESGSSGAYSYEWSPNLPANNSATQTIVSSGQYWLEVVDQAYPNCIARDTINIDTPSNPVADFNFTSVCQGYDLTFTDNVTLGDGPIISNEWDFDGDGLVDTTGVSILTNFQYGGIYPVTYWVEDNKGCEHDTTIMVQIFDGPNVDFSFDPTCSGYSTQFVNLTTPPPGSNNDTWLWNFVGQATLSTDENPTHLYSAPGTYDVNLQATSDDGCVADSTIQVVISQTPQADFTYFAPCAGEEITFTNTTTGNYVNSQWIFQNGLDTIRSVNAAYTFPAGGNLDVKLIIEDAVENCSDTVVITVVEIPKLTVQVNNSVDVTCNSGNDGIVELGVTQGAVPYTFSWTGSASTTAIANDLSFGTTTVTITDDNGCVITESINIGQPNPLSISNVSKDTIICIDDPVNLFAQGSGGSSPYIYTWVANNQTVAVGNLVTVTPNSAYTEYCLILSEQCGSPQDTACLVVSYPGEVDPTLMPDKTGECYPLEVAFTNSTNTTEVIDYTIWTYSDGVIDTTSGGSPTTHEFGLGVYDVDIEIVTDRGCRYFKSYDKLIEGYPYPEADFYVNPNPVSFYEAKVGAFSQTDNDVIGFEWFAEGAEPDYSSIQNPSFQYPNEIQNYPLILVVENSYGCTDSLEKLIRVENVVSIFSPNTFTPDGDGLNDTWKAHILGIDVRNFQLQIFNRWGETVFESLDPNGEWDGTYGGKIVQEGTYMWIIRAYDFENDNKHEFKGSVNILR